MNFPTHDASVWHFPTPTEKLELTGSSDTSKNSWDIVAHDIKLRGAIFLWVWHDVTKPFQHVYLLCS